MNTYEREYFVSRIRAGFIVIKFNGINIKIMTPTLEDEYLSNEIFMESFDDARADDILVYDDMIEWMMDRGLWSKDKDQKIKDYENNIEKLKVEIYNARANERERETIRAYIRATEKALTKLKLEKDDLYSKTCEGLALQDKAMFLFERCCYLDSERLDVSDMEISTLYYEYNQSQLSEKELRDLARNDPWRLAWYSKDHVSLFANEPNRTLSNDQKGILIWSNMYDNIQESMNCPTEDVINDDDLLDGWFIVQRKEQQSKKAQADIEARTNNNKISNADEILVMAGSKREAEAIHSMNSTNSEIIRKQRINKAKRLGTATDFDFDDRRIDISNQQRQMFKDKTRR